MWKETIALQWYIQLILWPAAALIWVLCAVFWGTGINWLMVPAAVSCTIIAVSCVAFTVVIGPSGIRASSILGFPRVSVAAEDVSEVCTARINPLGDFFGWGFRYKSRNDYGIIMREGPAVVVKAKDGRKVTITVNEAESAAEELRRRAVGS